MTCTPDGKITVNIRGLGVNNDGSYKRTFSGGYDDAGKWVAYSKTAVCPH